MPGSPTTPRHMSARAGAPRRVAFRPSNGVGPRNWSLTRLNGWPMHSPADASPCTLAGTCARLGADVVRYTFIVTDFHRLLLAGLSGALLALPCRVVQLIMTL
jgi:hypothetical protein